MSNVHDAAIACYRAPFRFEHGYIWDADSKMFSDNDSQAEHVIQRVRGWGYLQHKPRAAALQDELGEIVATALNDYWAKHADVQFGDVDAACNCHLYQPGTLDECAKHPGMGKT